ncbi:hypothetical protein [Hyphomicrobium sp.]|uniref:hypothetical protein n=1 Tax=Hyphomicrobium sp. TaxID=82 RepID=UPI000F964EA2|nr:hypothetical protein [Hyphomicrobium sp.]RUP08877.1 MAG: hypothetical protein EKK38_11830 [Hyphomicrobium sp.]
MAGITMVSLLVVLIVGTVVGALLGMVFGNAMEPNALLAVLSGLSGTIAGAVARNTLVEQGIGVGEYEEALPTSVFIFAVVSSFAGSLAGFVVATLVHEPSPAWIGGFAGLFSSVLTSLLVVAYHMSPR